MQQKRAEWRQNDHEWRIPETGERLLACSEGRGIALLAPMDDPVGE